MKLYTIGEVSYRLGGVSKEKIRGLEERGIISPQRVGRRQDRLYTLSDLEKMIVVLDEEKTEIAK